jgi:hypothetical protein
LEELVGFLTIPHSISATSRVWTFCAVKKIAVKPVMHMRQAMMVYRYPNFSETHPLMKRPMISPTFAPCAESASVDPA